MYVHSHFGVYGFATRDNGREVLVMKKARGAYAGLYALPGGGPEPMELLEEALFREIKEDTGLEVIEAVQIKAVSTRFTYSKDGMPALFRHMGVLYRLKLESDKAPLSNSGETCQWIEAGTLTESNAAPFLLQALRLVKMRDKTPEEV